MGFYWGIPHKWTLNKTFASGGKVPMGRGFLLYASHTYPVYYTTLFGCYKKNNQEKNMLILEKHSFFSCAVVALTACRSAIPVDCQPGCGHVPHFCIKCLERFFLLLVNLCRCRFIDSQTSLSSPPVNSIFATLECDLKRHHNSTALHLQLSTIGFTFGSQIIRASSVGRVPCVLNTQPNPTD